MSIVDIVLHQNILLAILVFTVLSVVTEILGRKILLALEDTSTSEWIFEHIFIPLARAIAIMIFILISYPALFGIQEAPSVQSLLTGSGHRVSTLMNVVFVLPLLFSLIPVVGSIPAFILPIQAIAGASLVFSWMQATAAHQPVHYFPDVPIVLIIVLLAIVSHSIARWISFHLSVAVNQWYNINDGQMIVYRIAILIIQLPVILIYTRGLGMQL